MLAFVFGMISGALESLRRRSDHFLSGLILRFGLGW